MTLQTDEREDELLRNPGEAHARKLNELENSAFKEIEDNYDTSTADSTDENRNIDRARQREENPMGYTGSGKGSATKQPFNLKSQLKRKGPLGIIAAILGGGIFAILPFFSAILPIDLMERFTSHNDSTSTAMERRAVKVFGHMTDPSNDPICADSTKSIKCRMGRISNKALYQLEKKGVKAVNYDGKKTGYPDKNPTAYDFTDRDGKTTRVEAKDMRTFLADKENRKFASMVLGTRGAFNVRVKAWTGKHINNKLYNKFGLRLAGGLADGQNKKLSSAERYRQAHDKLKAKIPGNERMSTVAASVRQKAEQHTNKVSRGGTAYLISAAGCIVVKAPSFIAAGVAAAQLAQVMPIVTEVVLSPGSKAKASGVDTANSFTGEDADLIGTMLTNKTPRESDGKMTSALDSPYLLAALGANTAKMSPSNFSPGYSILTHPAMTTGRDVEKATEPICNVILSPAAMWTAFAVDSAVTAAASATVVGGVLKVFASWAIGFVAEQAIGNLIEGAAQGIITDLATNEDIPNARGQEFGDVLGISAMTFFSAGGMARHLPVLSESQLTAFEEVKQENIAFNRDMELASVHPLDPSSKYTITGSILSSINEASLKNGTYGTPFGMLTGLASLPLNSISSLTTARAADRNYCSYAEDFGLDTGNADTTPAINASGMPCTGINGTQSNMETAEAITLLESEGWLNSESAEDLPDDATIEDLLGSGAIVENTPLREFVESCSNPDTGEYLYGAAGCIKPKIVSSGGGGADVCASLPESEVAKCQEVAANNPAPTAEEMGIKNPRSLDAMSTFLIDYQIAMSVNGEDEYVPGEGAAPVNEAEVVVSDGSWARPNAPGYNQISQPFGNPVGYNSGHPVGGGYGHNGTDISGSRKAEPAFAACSGTTTASTAGEYTTASTIVINCGDGITVGYHHTKLTAGSTVKAGDQIGIADRSGNTTGWHLHLTVKVNGKFVDPVPFFAERGVKLTG